ncbi:MAG: YkgJ family cysteine cluster protein [Verrucomicrobiae bacterium]|nr:YkgJ family cysteine cluster protein [Verrucomicrobiae bacterium]
MTSDFQCRRCGECCRIPGQVHLTESDIARMAALLGLNESDFIQQHTELARDRRNLVLKVRSDGACIFLEANHCTVYPARPQQCAGYPLEWNNPDWPKPCWGAQIPRADISSFS